SSRTSSWRTSAGPCGSAGSPSHGRRSECGILQGDSIMHMHAHEENEQNSYYLDQLCTIGICGALAVVLILAYVNNALNEILNPKFHQPVLWGGLALLILVAVRAVAIWIASGKQTATQGHTHAASHEHVHDHEHTHDCGHDHDHAHAHVHS